MSIESRVNAIFQASPGTNGDYLQVAFTSGPADYNLAFINKEGEGDWGKGFWGIKGVGAFAEVYANRIATFFSTYGTDAINLAIGSVTAHELGHEIGGSLFSKMFWDFNWSKTHTSNLMTNGDSKEAEADVNPAILPPLKLTTTQADRLYKNCNKKHGSAGGGSATGAGYYIEWGSVCSGVNSDGGWTGGCFPVPIYKPLQ